MGCFAPADRGAGCIGELVAAPPGRATLFGLSEGGPMSILFAALLTLVWVGLTAGSVVAAG